MIDKTEKNAFLTALSVLNTQENISVSDEDIAAFIDGSLDEEKRKTLISTFATNPELLSSVVSTYSALKEFNATAKQPAEKKSFSLFSWLKQHWLSSGSMTSAIAATFAYVMIMPVTDLRQLDDALSDNIYNASTDADAFYRQFPATKGLRAHPLNSNNEHFNYGYQQALSELNLGSNTLPLPSCANNKTCTIENSYLLLGKWTALTLAQCSSEYSVSTSFWENQGDIIDGLLANIDDANLDSLHLKSNEEQSLCVTAKNLNDKLN